MRWDEQFVIGNGQPTTDEEAPNVYRSYENECDMIIDEELFDEISQMYNIYAQRSSLKNIMFTPRDVKRQGTTDYYFCHLQVKFPRNS